MTSAAGGRTGRLDAFQRRHTWASFPLAVVYKYFEDFGGYLAALLTYYAFLSLFPLLLLLSTVLGFVLDGNPQLQHQIVQSALGQFPVVGGQLEDPRRLGGGTAGLVIGILGSLYGSLGIAQALQHAMNTAWSVPRNNRPNPFASRLRSLLLVGVGGLAVIGTTVLSTLGSSDVGSFGAALRVVVLAGSVVANAVIFLLAFRLSTTRDLGVRDVAVGAVTAAISWQVLQTVSVVYVRHVIRHASATNGVFALVLGLIAFLYLAAVTTVLSVEINVVRVDRLYPRALLTPFTDNVRLTRSDRRAYRKQAQAQRAKGFEDITVSFDRQDDDPPP